MVVMRAFSILIAAASLVACASTEAPPGRDSLADARAKPLSRQEIVGAMRSVSPRVAPCYDSYRKQGVYSAHVTIAGTGEVAAASVDGPDATTSNCIAAAVAHAVFPPFAGAPFEIVYPFVFR